MVSRPDITYAIGILSQFVQNPAHVHWDALKQVIIYLGTMKNHWLTFGGASKMLVEGYCNADWASQKHRHSISGYSFLFFWMWGRIMELEEATHCRVIEY